MELSNTDQIDWTNIGAEYTKDRKGIESACNRMVWDADFKGKSFPLMPAVAIQETIKGLKLPKVSAIAISHEMSPYGLIGIEANYKHCRVRVHIIDTGTEIIPLCMFVRWEIDFNKEQN